MAEKITSDNFSKYVEAYNLQEQARTILFELGLEGGDMMMEEGDRGGHGGDFRHNRPDNREVTSVDKSSDN